MIDSEVCLPKFCNAEQAARSSMNSETPRFSIGHLQLANWFADPSIQAPRQLPATNFNFHWMTAGWANV